MAKQTHKRRQLGDVAAIIAAAPSIAAAALQLGVSRQAIYDWLRQGVATRPDYRPRPARRGASVGDVPPGRPLPTSAPEWAAAVRAAYDFTPTEHVTLVVAEGLLAVALDAAAKPADRVAAAGRWLALVRALNLEDPRGEAETSADVRAFPRRVG